MAASIPPNEAHLWYLVIDDHPDEGKLGELRETLGREEREKAARFVFPRDRYLYLMAHAFLRKTLSHYADVEPADWIFKSNAFGRPEIDRPSPGRSLRFSLSHTRGMAVLLVASTEQTQPGLTDLPDAASYLASNPVLAPGINQKSQPGAKFELRVTPADFRSTPTDSEIQVGVDVEDTRSNRDILGIARHAFVPAEVEDLESLTGEAMTRRFFEYWTLKEAYLKALGLGLSLPMKRCSFRIGPESHDTTLSGQPVDGLSYWQFALFRPDEHFQVAVALRHQDRTDKVIRQFTVTDAGCAELGDRNE